MTRWRLGVVLLVSKPWAHEIDGLRRALGDGGLTRIPPHITLVPPVNVNVSDGSFERALAIVRGAAVATVPFSISLGPVDTFAPDTPVVMLRTASETAAELSRLRERVFRGPWERTVTWPFVPHVTLAEEASPQQLELAATVLPDYSCVMEVDAIHVLRQHEDRVWRPIAQARFEPPFVVGRGGIETELQLTEIVDPTVLACFPSIDSTSLRESRLAVVARRDGQVCGVIVAEICGTVLHISDVQVLGDCRGQGIGAHLVQRLCEVAKLRGVPEVRPAFTGDEARVSALDRFLEHVAGVSRL